MKDVTQTLNRYRECIRHLWNAYFVGLISQGESDILDEYDDICAMLFSSLVLNPLGRKEYKKAASYVAAPEPFSCLHVVPAVEPGIPIHISREKHRTPYWDYPVNFIKQGEVDMIFIDFFDFNVRESRDFQYCRVRIVASRVNPDLADRDALLDSSHVKFFFESA